MKTVQQLGSTNEQRVMQAAGQVPPGSMAVDHEEIEYQFDAVDVRPVQRWLVSSSPDSGISISPGSTKDLVDTYLDTEDWRLYRAGYALRVRAKGDGVEATVKSLDTAVDSIRRRREITEALQDGSVEELFNSTGPVGTWVQLIAGNRPLRPLFEVHTHRKVLMVHLNGHTAGEVALDETAIPLGEDDEPARLRRVEVEVDPVSLPGLQPFVEKMRADCGLYPATSSKFEAGLFALGLRPVGIPDLGSTTVDASMSIGEVTFAVLRKHFTVFLSKEAGTRLGEDAEELHDMRVAARRLRAAMSLFSEALPVRADRLRGELKWVAAALGEVRDLDVQLEQLDAWIEEAEPSDREALGALAAALRQRRNAARKRMLRVLNSRRYERFVASYISMLQHGPLRRSSASRTPVLAVAPDLISRRYRKVRKQGDRISKASPAEDYHALRIQCKRLRYALEFLSGVYGKPAKALTKPLVRLQDVLGLHQDAEVAVSHLRELSTTYGRKLPPQAIFVMGEIAERYNQQAADLRKQFPEVYREIKGKPWKALSRVMERERLTAGGEAGD